MEKFTQRFEEQKGGLYQFKIEPKTDNLDGGGKKKNKLSPCSENWRKKFLEIKVERKTIEIVNKSNRFVSINRISLNQGITNILYYLSNKRLFINSYNK